MFSMDLEERLRTYCRRGRTAADFSIPVAMGHVSA